MYRECTSHYYKGGAVHPTGLIVNQGVASSRILKHLVEAEKSTFQEELPFQRSESTTGVQQGTLFVC
jgi:hypothetical protein